MWVSVWFVSMVSVCRIVCVSLVCGWGLSHVCVGVSVCVCFFCWCVCVVSVRVVVVCVNFEKERYQKPSIVN